MQEYGIHDTSRPRSAAIEYVAFLNFDKICFWNAKVLLSLTS